MKTKAVIVAISVMLILCTSNLHAQGTRKRTPTAQSSQPVSTQTATTKDGRTVMLKSDGTWEYAKEAQAANASNVPRSGRKNSNLSFEVGLVFKSGDVKPVARATFYLLDDDLAKILKEAGLQAPRRFSSGGNPEEDLVDAFASSVRFSSLEDYKEFYPAAMTALKPHIIQSVITDFGGKGSFEPVPAGTYYLMGVTETPRGYAIWNLKVDLKLGQNSVTLDQNNAATAI